VEDRIGPGTVIVDNFGVWSGRSFVAGVRYHEIGRRRAEDVRGVLRFPEPSSTRAS
jgi:hypothetical protein